MNGKMTHRLLVPGALLLAFGTIGAQEAFASRATTAVMGSGDAGTVLNGGSFYYDDPYNMFYNPAVINDYKNWATIEKSNFSGTSYQGALGTTAQGGFITSMGNFSVGLYLNRGNELITNQQIATGTSSATVANSMPYAGSLVPIRPIELFVGGDMGFKWGASLGYASNFATAGTASDIMLSAGAEINGLEPFATAKVSGTEPAGSHYFYRLGARYKWGEWIPYAAFETAGDTPTGGSAIKEVTWGIGLGRSAKLNENVRLNYALSYWTPADSGGAVTVTRYIIPIDLAVEGDATSWLTLRAGLNYRAFDRISSTSVGDSTTGRIGASAHAGKVDFDFAVGNTPTTTETGTALDAQNFSFANGVFSVASLTYHW